MQYRVLSSFISYLFQYYFIGVDFRDNLSHSLQAEHMQDKPDSSVPPTPSCLSNDEKHFLFLFVVESFEKPVLVCHNGKVFNAVI